MQKPTATRFSAIIPNYNHADFVVHTLDAAIEQTVAFDEILIIDDASTDDSVARIEARIRDVPHARLIRNPHNLGVIATSNRGLAEATGDFVCYLAADDRYDRRIVAWCHEAVARYPDVAMISGNTCVLNIATSTHHYLRLPFAPQLGRYTRADIATIARHRAFTFNMGANVIRRDAHREVGGLIPAMAWSSDWFSYLLIACRHPFAVVPQQFLTVRQVVGQYSNAANDWAQQRHILTTFIRILKNDYPAEYDFFRRGALLPTYDAAALGLLLRTPDLRHYLTPLLVWRLLSYKLLRHIGRRVPLNWRGRIRQWVKV
jgi:glycosyltransferase involved in cell wall biosynthesis